MSNPERKEQEQNPYAFINAYVNKLLENVNPIIDAGLRPVKESELHALEPSYPEYVHYDKGIDWDVSGTERKPHFLGSIALRILDHLARSGQRAVPDPHFASVRRRTNLFDDRIDLMLEIRQLQIEGGVTVDGRHLSFEPENKLIEITVADTGAHDDSRLMRDHIKYQYKPLSKELSSELIKGKYSTSADFRIPLISTERSDLENLQGVFSEYPPEAFSHK